MIKAILQWKKNDLTVGFIASCFDLLHAGHTLALAEAKEQCDVLIVGLQSDPTLDRKEKNLPIQGLYERYLQLDSLVSVDYIIPYSTEEDLLNLLITLEPDIRFLGSDYTDKDFTGKELEIELIYLDRKHGWSSSKLRKKVK